MAKENHEEIHVSEEDAELFDRLIKLPKEARDKIIDAVKAYELMMHADEKVLISGSC